MLSRNDYTAPCPECAVSALFQRLQLDFELRYGLWQIGPRERHWYLQQPADPAARARIARDQKLKRHQRQLNRRMELGQ